MLSQSYKAYFAEYALCIPEGDIPSYQHIYVIMCQALTELLVDEREEGRVEEVEIGREEEIVLTKKIYKLQAQGKSIDNIVEECDLKLSQVKK